MDTISIDKMFNSILFNFIDGFFGTRKKTALEYRGYHQAFILILLEYMGVLYISYELYKNERIWVIGLTLGWTWCIMYRFISPIPIGVRYFHKFGMYIPKEIFNKETHTVFFIKELFDLITVTVFYRLLWVSLFGNEYYKNMASFVWITHILITVYIYQKEETTIYLHKRWKEQEKYETDVVTELSTDICDNIQDFFADVARFLDPNIIMQLMYKQLKYNIINNIMPLIGIRLKEEEPEGTFAEQDRKCEERRLQNIYNVLAKKNELNLKN